MSVRRIAASSSLLLLVALLAVPVHAWATAAPSSGQVLRYNLGVGATTGVDPAYDMDPDVSNALGAPLYRRSANSRPTPFLASGMPRVSNSGRRYDVTLRLARWSDGKPVLASDVAYGVSRARAKRQYFTLVSLAGVKVSAPNSRTVRFDLPRAMPWFEQVLTTQAVVPMPAHVIAKRKEAWDSASSFVSAGPFTLARSTKRGTLTLARNPRWWGASGMKLNRIEFVRMTAAQARSRFLAGTLHSGRPGSMYASRQPADDSVRVTPQSEQSMLLYVNTRQTGLGDARVRRALALAVDRASIAALPPDPSVPIASTFPTNLPGGSVAAPGTERYLASSGAADPTRAAQLLAAAGWAARPLTLAHVSNGDAAKVAAALVEDFAAAGVTVVPKSYSEAAFAKRGVGISPTSSSIDLLLQGWVADVPDARDFHQLFRCSAVAAGLNPANYCSKAFDTAYSNAGLFAPAFTRLGRVADAEEILTGESGDFPALPLYQPRPATLVSRKASGLLFLNDGSATFERVVIQR